MNTSINPAVAYFRVSTTKQNSQRQHENVGAFATAKGHTLTKVFTDELSGKTLTAERVGFKKMLAYAIKNNIKSLFCSELSRIGRRVSDCVHTIETLVEEHQMTVFIQHPNELMFSPDKEGKLDIMQKTMLMMLSLGAEMELHFQQTRRLEGIEIAKRENRYKGRVKGSKYSVDQLLERHSDIVTLANLNKLPDTTIAKTCRKGLSTVKRVKKALIVH